MKAVKFRVQNFRNIDDSGWIPVERITAFVGRNESGKTALLRAFHKFNPASPQPYDPQREFPRDRYNREYVAGGSKGENWPVCSVCFSLPKEFRAEIASLLGEEQHPPQEAILTRYYDNSLSFAYHPVLVEKPLPPFLSLKDLPTLQTPRAVFHRRLRIRRSQRQRSARRWRVGQRAGRIS